MPRQVSEGRQTRPANGDQVPAVPQIALNRPLILASASPRRAELLRQVEIAFEVQVSEAAEEADEPGVPAAEVALSHAREKAADVASRRPDRLVLGADTVVVLDGRVLGKPVDADDAARMLRALSGRTHEVITGVAIAFSDGAGPQVVAETHVSTNVRFRELGEDEIAWYVASGEPMDKAGGYGIQGRGAVLVREIDGCYFTVVGLPLSDTWQILRELGYGFVRPGT